MTVEYRNDLIHKRQLSSERPRFDPNSETLCSLTSYSYLFLKATEVISRVLKNVSRDNNV
ncbi:hypothetical protein E2C01_003313 [Portunus trituberculatus]|uniref:Uncharacterized protein n=1 Tax=Portunus trituberculatus TaxID=210409 RepID=A0A5B7CT81_PORTR|nr:hypothetical protein [Portunus trituberculatus]